jgi:hypothetical protein
MAQDMMRKGDTVFAAKRIEYLQQGKPFIFKGQTCTMGEIGMEKFSVSFDFERETEYKSPLTGKIFTVPYVTRKNMEFYLRDIDLFYKPDKVTLKRRSL